MDNAAIKNFRDFLLQYNKISESCFLHCVNHLSDRDLSQDESGCVDMCTKKHVSVNHKVMQVYMDIQPHLINKRIEEVNKQAAVLESQKIAVTKTEETDSENLNEVNNKNSVVESKSSAVQDNNRKHMFEVTDSKLYEIGIFKPPLKWHQIVQQNSADST